MSQVRVRLIGAGGGMIGMVGMVALACKSCEGYWVNIFNTIQNIGGVTQVNMQVMVAFFHLFSGRWRLLPWLLSPEMQYH